MSLGLLKPPGEFGVDIAVGEGQSLGVPMSLGGPAFGFFACQKKFVQKYSRATGRRDRRQRRAARVCFDARHPRAAYPPRKGDIEYLHQSDALCPGGHRVHGFAGQSGIAPHRRDQSRPAPMTLKRGYREQTGLKPLFPGPFFNEFVLQSDDLTAAVRRLRGAENRSRHRLGAMVSGAERLPSWCASPK